MSATHEGAVIVRFRFVLCLVFSLLLGCVIGGCRQGHATKNATSTMNGHHHTAHASHVKSGPRSAWSTLRANLRSASYDDASRRTIMCDEDDDDDDDDDAITTTLSNPTRPDTKGAGEKRAADELTKVVLAVASERDLTQNDVPNEGAIRAARGYGSGTERPPRS